MAFIDEDERVLRQVIQQRRRGLARHAAGKVARIILDAVAVADFLHHLHIEQRPLMNALGFEQLVLLHVPDERQETGFVTRAQRAERFAILLLQGGQQSTSQTLELRAKFERLAQQRRKAVIRYWSVQIVQHAVNVHALGCRAAANIRHGLPVSVVAGNFIRVPQVPLIERIAAGSGMDAADDWIAERASKGDIVIPADIPLASRCVKSVATVIAPNGRPYTEDSIGMTLAVRNLMHDLRSAGEVTGGPRAFSPRDRSAFLSALEEAVDEVLRAVPAEALDSEAIERAKTRLVAETIYSTDSQSSLARIYGSALAIGETLEDVRRWPLEIEAVLKDDLASASERYLILRRSVTGYLQKPAS